jgi:prepilin-type N-terminal cleavage/methylation domain-containing protein
MRARPTLHRSRTGFTLIELSVVIVIIGLIAGGIIIGKDMIKTAEIYKTISQKQRFDAAASTFVSKYNCIPGDCKARSRFGWDTDLPGNGDGNEDGRVGGINQPVNNDEFKLFWRHLYDAQLINDTGAPGNGLPGASTRGYGVSGSSPGYNSPGCPICRTIAQQPDGNPPTVTAGGWAFQQLRNNTTLNCSITTTWTAAGGTLPNWNAFELMDFMLGVHGTGGAAGVVSAADAGAIDRKIDDGLPLTGAVLAFNPYMYSDPGCSGNVELGALRPDSGCAAGNTYTTTVSGPGCDLIIRSEVNF